MDEEEYNEREREMYAMLDHDAARYELALLSYEGQFDPDHNSPYEIRGFTLLPEWQQNVHYRVADLVLAHGYKKIG